MPRTGPPLPGVLTVILWGVLCLGAAPARADRSFDLTLVTPTVDNYGLLAVERAYTPRQWEFGFSATLGYMHDPLHLQLHDPTTGMAGVHQLVHDQIGLDLGASLGIWDYLTLAAALPIAAQWYDAGILGDMAVPTTTPMGSALVPTTSTGIYQGQPAQNVGLAGAGSRDPRLSLKARLPRWRDLGLAVVLTVTLPLGNPNSFMGDKGATFRPLLAADGLFAGRLSVAANLGFIVRSQSVFADPSVQPPRAPVPLLSVGDELTWALGLSLKVHRIAALGLEALGTAPLGDPNGQPNADLLAVVYVRVSERFRVILGGGGGLVPASPRRDDGRLLLSVGWTPSPSQAGGAL